eukprot:3531873-Pleurochrysis_carterae.AAC.1
MANGHRSGRVKTTSDRSSGLLGIMDRSHRIRLFGLDLWLYFGFAATATTSINQPNQAARPRPTRVNNSIRTSLFQQYLANIYRLMILYSWYVTLARRPDKNHNKQVMYSYRSRVLNIFACLGLPDYRNTQVTC